MSNSSMSNSSQLDEEIIKLEEELKVIAELNNEIQFNQALDEYVKKLKKYLSENNEATINFDIDSIENVSYDNRHKLLRNSPYDELMDVEGSTVLTNNSSKAPEKTHLLTIHKLDSTKTGLESDQVAASYLYTDDMQNFKIGLQSIKEAIQSLGTNVVEELEISNGTISGGKRSKRKSSKRKSSKRKSSKRGGKGKRSTKHRR